jgi:phosphoesterase RecJ-like protein
VTGEKLPGTLELIDASFVVDADEAAGIFGLRPDDGMRSAGDVVPDGFDENERAEDDLAGEDDRFEDDDVSAVQYLAIAMDFTSAERLEGREALFDDAAETLCIDHHVTSRPDCDYNYIEYEAAATSEIVYRLLRSMALPVTERAATALYVGIVTDTGRFQYTNTTPDTHRIAAELLVAGADFAAAYRDIYQSVKAEKLIVQSAALGTLEIFADGMAAMAYARADMLARFGAGEDETDGMSELLRGIIGVETAVFLRERPDGRVKVSMRSKSRFDVAAFAAEFGGGGHIRAAGFISELSVDETCAMLKERLGAALCRAQDGADAGV